MKFERFFEDTSNFECLEGWFPLILDYDACIEFMIMAMWEKAERDRLRELSFENSFDRFAYKWSLARENVGHIIVTL